jgi:uncharacterized membrane protein
MKTRCLIAFTIVCALLLSLLPLSYAESQDYIEYDVEVNVDNSAGWTITRVADINASIDVEGFPSRVAALIDVAVDLTQREMVLDAESLQVSDEVSWETQSRTTVYSFTWQNFTVTESGGITLGDVFGVSGFFSSFFGEGAIQISYPSDYSVQSVSPEPNERDDSTQTLRWYRTQDFVNGKPSMTFVEAQSGGSDEWQQYAVIGAGLTVAIAAALLGLYLVKIRKPRARVSTSETPARTPLIESDEEKIIKIIRSSGGSMRQVAITEQCGFSKAKTSQLLAVLEQKQVITRYKKGRDKIVTLNERVASDKS